VGLPALTRAAKLGQRAARVGFDWPDARGVTDKLREELAELDAALARADGDGSAEELGDLLFTASQLARHLGVDPETCLRSANRKFEQRFGGVERALAADGRSAAEVTPAELEKLWERAKRQHG
jgi:ATP diphosphatase